MTIRYDERGVEQKKKREEVKKVWEVPWTVEKKGEGIWGGGGGVIAVWREGKERRMCVSHEIWGRWWKGMKRGGG